jgi:UDP-3-O-[3-hydroxymyristoyl] glucosamine N-acyltransferase
VSDPRFYNLHTPLPAHAVAKAGAADLSGGKGNHLLNDVAALAFAGAGDIAYLRNGAKLDAADTLNAGLVFCTKGQMQALLSAGVKAVAITEHPRRAFIRAAASLVQPIVANWKTGTISPHANLHADVEIAPGACIGAGAKIGKHSSIGPSAVIGPGCVLGDNCVIGANAVIEFTLMGDRVDIRPGAVIGQAGLGVLEGDEGIMAMPHFGCVRLGDYVRIGANSTIDRAVFGQTIIGARSKIDNLVHIAHNVRLGQDCVLASLCGIAGSSVLGNMVMMGGRAGVIDHIAIGDGARIGAAAVVMNNVGAGQTWSGYPARPLRRFLREQLTLEKISGKTGPIDDHNA